MKEIYKVIVCSLPDYDDLVAELYVKNKFIGIISQEEKRGEYVVELDSSDGRFILDLNSLMEIIQLGVAKLTAVG